MGRGGACPPPMGEGLVLMGGGIGIEVPGEGWGLSPSYGGGAGLDTMEEWVGIKGRGWSPPAGLLGIVIWFLYAGYVLTENWTVCCC